MPPVVPDPDDVLRLLNAQLSKQLDDFPIGLGRREVFEVTGQSTLRKVHGAGCIGASCNQNPDDLLVAMDDRSGQRRRTIVLLA